MVILQSTSSVRGAKSIRARLSQRMDLWDLHRTARSCPRATTSPCSVRGAKSIRARLSQRMDLWDLHRTRRILSFAQSCPRATTPRNTAEEKLGIIPSNDALIALRAGEATTSHKKCRETKHLSDIFCDGSIGFDPIFFLLDQRNPIFFLLDQRI